MKSGTRKVDILLRKMRISQSNLKNNFVKSISRGWERHSLFMIAFREYVKRQSAGASSREKVLLHKFVELCDRRLEARLMAEKKRERAIGFTAGLKGKYGADLENGKPPSGYEEGYIEAYKRGFYHRGLLIDQVLREFLSAPPID